MQEKQDKIDVNRSRAYSNVSKDSNCTYAAIESYLKFLLFLIKLSFSDTTVIEGGRERKHRWDLSLLFWETRYSN